jgi:hypothetical protein
VVVERDQALIGHGAHLLDRDAEQLAGRVEAEQLLEVTGLLLVRLVGHRRSVPGPADPEHSGPASLPSRPCLS